MNINFEKATQSFDSLSFKNRFKAVGQLLKHTFTIVGRDEDIIKPWIRLIIYHFVMVTSFFYALMGFWVSLPLVWLAWLIAPILFLYKHFYNNKQEMRLSWTVNETIVGRDPTYKGAVKASKEVKSQIRKLAWLDIAMAFIQKGKNFGEGLAQTIISVLIAGLEEVWDLANHFLLPSVAVDRLDLKPAIQKMKVLKSNVPESLTGIFGIDFLGDIVKRITVPLYIIALIAAVALGVVLSGWLPSFSMDLSGSEKVIHFTMVPLVVLWFIGKLGSNFLERTVTAVKVTYFTIFYDQITHPESIAPDLQADLVDYLKLKNVDAVEDLDKQRTESEANAGGRTVSYPTASA